MTKFKKGQKVRLIRCAYDDLDEEEVIVGKIYEIGAVNKNLMDISVSPNCTTAYILMPPRWIVAEECLGLAKSEPKFKVGDLVKAISPPVDDKECKEILIGKTYRIRSIVIEKTDAITPNGEASYDLEHINGKDGWWVSETILKLVKTTSKGKTAKRAWTEAEFWFPDLKHNTER